MRLADPQLPGMAEYRLCHRHALYSALLWGALFWVQGPGPTLDHILSMWTIAVLMMVTLSIVAHSVPLACALFIAPVSLSAAAALTRAGAPRSEEHTSELQSLMRISYAVFCLKKKT